MSKEPTPLFDELTLAQISCDQVISEGEIALQQMEQSLCAWQALLDAPEQPSGPSEDRELVLQVIEGGRERKRGP